MENTGEILCQISSLKDMLDQVNQEIEANIQVTREIESEIVKCEEIESALAVKESDLTRTLYTLQFEISGLMAVTFGSMKSVESLEKDLCRVKSERDEIIKRINDKRESFVASCLEFQRVIDSGEDNELKNLSREQEFLENEIQLLEEKNNALKNSMLAFIEEILQDLNDSNSALLVEIENGKREKEKLLQDIDSLMTTLHQLY